MRPLTWVFLSAVIGLALILGCGGDGDGDGGPQPVTGVDVSPGAADVQIGDTVELTGTVSGGENKDLTWYVNGVENGDFTVGRITENSPVTYTAPDQLPDPSEVMVKAVSVEDTTKMDSCTVSLLFTKIYVDADNGNDAGTGAVNIPLKSITHALEIADSGMTVPVHPGIYDPENGEEFALQIPIGVSLVGMDWETCVIRGSQAVGVHSAFWQTGDHVALRKFTIETGQIDPTWSHAIYLNASHALLDSIRIHERADNSVLRCLDTEDVTISNCYFVVDDGNRDERGFEVINTNTGTIIENCTLTGFGYGMMFTGTQDALVQGCTITRSSIGVYLVHGLESDPNVDLGGGPRGSAGGNTFTDYSTCGLTNQTTHLIYAKFNTWENNPPQLDVDICNEGDGNIVTQ